MTAPTKAKNAAATSWSAWSGWLERSMDAPSPAGVRPFGLEFVEYVDDAVLPEVPELTYDPQRQVNVLSDGTVVTEARHLIRAGTSYDTRYDHQWFTDQD